MRTLYKLFFSFCMCSFALAQTSSEKPGNHFGDFKIVASREYFKMTEGDHKELIGLYLQGRPYMRIDKNGNQWNQYEVAPFEIHVRADNLSSIKLAEIRAAAFKYLYVDNISKGITVSTDTRFIEFDYQDFGQGESPDRNLQIMDIAIAKNSTGIRYTTTNGHYFVFGAVAGFGSSSNLRGDREKMGLTLSNLDPMVDLNGKENDIYNGGNIEFILGAFTEINFNEKFHLYGSAYQTTNALKSTWIYEAPEQVTVADTKDPNILTTKTLTHFRKIYISSNRSRLTLGVQTDLGKLISPLLTGIMLNAGVDMNRYDIIYDRLEYMTRLQGSPSKTESIDFQTAAPIKSFNQVQFNVGLKISPSVIFKRQKDRAKYAEMLDMYRR